MITSLKQCVQPILHKSCLGSYSLKITKDPESHFHVLLCLFLRFPYQYYQDAYVGKQQLLQKDTIQKFRHTENLEAAVQQIQTLQQTVQDDKRCPMTPACMTSQLDAVEKSAEYISSVFVMNSIDDILTQKK